MTKTEKLSLPQWEATDYFQRSDFNDAFAALDSGYAEAMEASAALPWVMGTLDLTDAAAGDVVHDFGFCPSAVIVWGAISYPAVGFADMDIQCKTFATGASNTGYWIFTYSGQQLSVAERYSHAPNPVYYIAFRS
jgi:hypothetical protein